jgi:predicted RNA-binding protein
VISHTESRHIASENTWDAVKKHKVWGAPSAHHNQRMVSEVKSGDLLAFYLLAPVRGVVGFYRAESAMFTDMNSEPWSGRIYPYRIKIRPLSKEAAELRQPIRFNEIVGKIGKVQNRWSLFGRAIVPLTDDEYSMLCSLANLPSPNKVSARNDL